MVERVRIDIDDSRAVIVGPADPVTVSRCHELVLVEVHQRVLQVFTACGLIESTWRV